MPVKRRLPPSSTRLAAALVAAPRLLLVPPSATDVIASVPPVTVVAPVKLLLPDSVQVLPPLFVRPPAPSMVPETVPAPVLEAESVSKWPPLSTALLIVNAPVEVVVKAAAAPSVSESEASSVWVLLSCCAMPPAPSVSKAPPVAENVNAPAPVAKMSPCTLRLAASTGRLVAAVPNEAKSVVESSVGAIPPPQLPPVEK